MKELLPYQAPATHAVKMLSVDFVAQSSAYLENPNIKDPFIW